MNTSERVIVVTGGSRGIGRSVCYSFSASNTIVYFSYNTNIRAANETANHIIKNGGRVVFKKVDVSSLKEVIDFFDFILDKSKRIDVLVNNAGVNSDGLLIRMNEERWNKVIDVNLNGTFHCMKTVSRTMIQQKYGRIINITSIVGITGNSGQSNYSASKAGIIGLTKSVARELASRNITVNAIAPGYINTDMTKKINDNNKLIINQIPLGRKGIPEDVSSLVYFLASNKASYITGQVINVNGGMYM